MNKKQITKTVAVEVAANLFCMLQLCFELESIDNYHMPVRVFVYVCECVCVYMRDSLKDYQ